MRSCLIALLALAIPVAAALGMLGLLLDQIYSMMPLSRAMGEVAWSSGKDFLLVSIPMFILLGEILLRSGLADRMYVSLSAWLGRLPGGLLHANMSPCALFAATWRLWTPQTVFPQIPFFAALRTVPGWIDWFALAGMLAGLLGLLFTPGERRAWIPSPARRSRTWLSCSRCDPRRRAASPEPASGRSSGTSSNDRRS